MEVLKDVINIGTSDNDLKLFEGQYNLKHGMSYNSYVIKDEKTVILDTIDKAVTGIWLQNLEEALEEKNPDYLIISHMEPDHAYNISTLLRKYPNMKIVGNMFTFNILSGFLGDEDISSRKVIVKEGDILDIGKHKLQFFMAPMVHWPEVMVTYEQTEKILFTADAFGKFGSLEVEDNWIDEARRYYIGIVGKYGMQVQTLLTKVSNLNINVICPLHGPILKENLEYYIDKYNTWSSYEPEEDGVLIACSSIYGNTLEAAKKIERILKEKGIHVVLTDLTRDDWAEAVANAFRFSKLIIASSSYNAGLFPPMEQFLNRLKDRNYQKRKVGIIENGSWAPSAGRCMKNILNEMKELEIIEPVITIKSTLNEDSLEKIKDFVEKI